MNHQRLLLTLLLMVALGGGPVGAGAPETEDDHAVDRVMVDIENPMKASRVVHELKRINTHRTREALLHIALGKVPDVSPTVETAAAQAFMETIPDKRDAWLLAASNNQRIRWFPVPKDAATKGHEIDEFNWPLIQNLVDFNNPLSSHKISVYDRIKNGLTPEELERIRLFMLLLIQDYGNKMTAQKNDMMVRIVAAYEEAEWTREVRPRAPYSILAGTYLQLKVALMSLADPKANDLLRMELDKWKSPVRNVILSALAYRGDLSAKAECLKVAKSTDDGLIRYITFDGYCSRATGEELDAIEYLVTEKPYYVTYKMPEVATRNLLNRSRAVARDRIQSNKPAWFEVEMRVKAKQKRESEALEGPRSRYKPFVLNREVVPPERQANVAAGKKPFQLRPLPAAQAGNVRRMLHEVSNFKDVYGKKPIEERRVGGAERSQGESMKTMLRGMISEFPDTEEAGEARKHLFDIHILHEDLSEAQAECETASREAPGTEAESLLWLRLGEALKNRQDYARASMAFAQVLDPVQKGRGYLRPMEAEFAGKFQMPVRIEKENYVQAQIGWIECLYRLGRKEPADAKRADLTTRYPEFKARIDSILNPLFK